MRTRCFPMGLGCLLVSTLAACGFQGATSPPEAVASARAPRSQTQTEAMVRSSAACESPDAVPVATEPTAERPRPRRPEPGSDRNRRIGRRDADRWWGSGGPTQPRTPEPTRPTSNPPAAQPESSCAGVPAATEAQRREEAAVVELVNAHRAKGAWCGNEWFPPAPPLRVDARLQCAARAHSHDMAVHGYFSHDDLRGRSPFDRMDALGYPFGAAENIYAGRPDARSAVASWMKSPGHCSNIMDANLDEIGVGHASADDMYGNYWTQTFGRR